MAVSSLTKSRYRTILIVVASILIITSAAGGTILLLKQYAPVKTEDMASSESVKNEVSPVKKAEDLFAKGDYAGAKTQYQSVLETYKAQHNEAGAKDIEMQLRIIDATAKAPQAPQNTDRNRVVVGSKPE